MINCNDGIPSKYKDSKTTLDEIIAGDGIIGFTPKGKILFYDGNHYLIPEMTYPNFTKSGRHIIFLRSNQDAKTAADFDMGLWKMNDLGKKMRKISSMDLDDIALSSNGKYLAYVHSYFETEEQQSCRSAIGILNLRTMHHIQITDHNTEYSNPDWSPDGKKIVFTKFFKNAEKLFIMNKFGMEQHLAFKQSVNVFYDNARWSPDGKFIAYTKETDQGTSLLIYNLATHHSYVVATDVFWATPAWSTHEHYLAFASVAQKGGYAAILNLRTGKRLIVDKHPIVYSRFTWAVIHKTK